MRKRRMLRSILAAAMVVCLFAVELSPAMAAQKVTQEQINSLKSEAKDLDAKQKEIQKKINALSAELKNHAAKKALLDDQINVLITEIANTENQIVHYGELITISEGELQVAQEEEAKQYELFSQRVRSMEKQGKVDYWSVLFRATSFSDLLTRLDIINEIMRYDQRVINDYKTIQAEVKAKMEELEGQRAEAEEIKATLQTQKTELDKQRDAANALMQELRADSAEAKAEMDALAKEEEAILAEAVRLSKIYAQQNQDPATQGGYIWPVSSRYITSTMGGRTSPGGIGSTNHKGTDIGRVGYTSEIYAAKAGTVIISTYSKSYGNYVVISHGSGNTTLYGHMSSRKVNVGQRVKQGDVIGITGSTGNSTGPHLHFEITENGVRVNPLKHGAQPQKGYLSGYTLSGSA
ncbi:MAG: peptidoglycan DD-metalloendopeptidase family protein [Oscillibacter sp.]|nr:peptidoglycan DD-metalloendopeptidase family protein [Oscillibacter sp.]MBQ2996446.1 peptidoglycan DD-metalloendopeptidase family protein [Oscillibacter sp.]